MGTAIALSEKQLAEKLAEFIVNCRYEDLPQETIARVKEYIIDVVGCMVDVCAQSSGPVPEMATPA
jgi:2-methylcitrate dehydratase PrpD